MSNAEFGEKAPCWIRRDPEEERERVQRHTHMMEEMLRDDHADLAGSSQVTTVLIAFNRIAEDGNLVLSGAEEHLGTLLGIKHQNSEPVAVIADYQVWIHGPLGEDGEPESSVQVHAADIIEVPVRQIDELCGATGTYADFEALEARGETS